jgi:hypothetical protein
MQEIVKAPKSIQNGFSFVAWVRAHKSSLSVAEATGFVSLSGGLDFYFFHRALVVVGFVATR